LSGPGNGGMLDSLGLVVFTVAAGLFFALLVWLGKPAPQ
jgi:hypothetical protein